MYLIAELYLDTNKNSECLWFLTIMIFPSVLKFFYLNIKLKYYNISQKYKIIFFYIKYYHVKHHRISNKNVKKINATNQLFYKCYQLIWYFFSKKDIFGTIHGSAWH